MMKKLFYWSVGTIAFLLIAVVILVLTLDTAQFKRLLSEQVKTHTGRELVIEGELGLRFYPSIGLTVEGASLSQPPTMEGQLLSVERINFDLALLPLLKGSIEIDEVELIKPDIRLILLADGSSSLDGLTGEAAATPEPVSQPVADNTQYDEDLTKTQEQPLSFHLNGFTLTDASVVIEDEVNGRTEVKGVNLSINDFAFDAFTPLHLSAQLQQAKNSLNIELAMQLKVAQEWQKSEFKDLTLNLSATAHSEQGTNSLNPVELTIAHFAFDQESPLNLSLTASSAGIKARMQLALTLFVSSLFDRIDANKLDLNLNASGDALPGGSKQIALKGDVHYLFADKQLEITPLTVGIDSFTLKGFVSVVLDTLPRIALRLDSDLLDLNTLLPAQSDAGAEQAAPTVPKTASSEPEQQPDLSFLKQFELNGEVNIAKVMVNELKFSDLHKTFSVKNGVARLDECHVTLYEGVLDCQAELDARKKLPVYRFTGKLKGVQSLPLLTDAADLKILGGIANSDISINGRGLDSDAILKGAKGNIRVDFSDGALYGINIPQKIRGVKAKLTGSDQNEAELEQKTDFSSLTATFALADGKVTTDDLLLLSPLLRIAGKGSSDIVAQTLDLLFETSIVGTLKGQGGRERDELSGVTLPLSIKGPFSSPKFALDYDALYKSQAKKVVDEKIDKLSSKADQRLEKEKQKLSEKLDKQLDEQKLKDKLNSLKLKL